MLPSSVNTFLNKSPTAEVASFILSIKFLELISSNALPFFSILSAICFKRLSSGNLTPNNNLTASTTPLITSLILPKIVPKVLAIVPRGPSILDLTPFIASPIDLGNAIMSLTKLPSLIL